MTKAEFPWRFRAKPIRAIDGDTIEVLVDHGFRHFSTQRIRLKDINCHEVNSPFPELREAAFQAKAATERWLNNVDKSVEWPLTIYTGKLSFDRWVGLVVDSNGHDLGDHLVINGYAVVNS